ncbi:hypothetical protein ACFSJW_02425 [Flavobacterium artemisiae]|uniref:Molybdenum ABC transporter permease n=1 Tax=Flavobacterium artemisiae TaxID=2126556 RepID=A0ABW4HJV0_9FLAO
MAQIILILLAMIVIGAAIYITRYKGKGKPKVGIKRDNNSEYFKDYINLKLYWTSLGFIFVGISLLLVIVVLELVNV